MSCNNDDTFAAALFAFQSFLAKMSRLNMAAGRQFGSYVRLPFPIGPLLCVPLSDVPHHPRAHTATAPYLARQAFGSLQRRYNTFHSMLSYQPPDLLPAFSNSRVQ